MAKTINQFQRESRMDCYAENAQLRAENEKLAAALVAKDAALERCTKFTQEDYDALELKPHAALVRKLKAEAVRSVIPKFVVEPSTQANAIKAYADHIERENEHG